MILQVIEVNVNDIIVINFDLIETDQNAML